MSDLCRRCLPLVEIAGRRLLLFDAAAAWLRARMPSRARFAALQPRVRFRRADRPPAPPEEPAVVHVAPRVEASPDSAAVSSAMARREDEGEEQGRALMEIERAYRHHAILNHEDLPGSHGDGSRASPGPGTLRYK